MKNAEKRYYVKEDRQGGCFGMDRLYTIEEWREQAKEWCEMDDNDGLWQYMDKLPKDQVIDFIDDMWTITLEETTFTYDLLRIAFNEYKELANLVENSKKSLEELCKELNGHNLENDLFDLNYKHIVATIKSESGKLKVLEFIDIWNDTTGESWECIHIDELDIWLK